MPKKLLCIYAGLLMLAANVSVGSTSAMAASGTADYRGRCVNCESGARQYEHAFLVSKENGKKIELTVHTEEEVNAVFAEVVALKNHQISPVPFDYLKDGCYARAHSISFLLDQKGIISGKAFMEGKIYYDAPKQGEMGWSYQVAAVVLVKKGGQVIPYVIDPSFFSKPVPGSEWEAKFTKNAKTKITRQYFTNRFSYDPNDRDAEFVSFDDDRLRDMESTNTNFSRALYVLNHPGMAEYPVDGALSICQGPCKEARQYERALFVAKEGGPKIDLTVLTEEEANTAFAEIVARGDIPFAYLKDGSYAHAHKMALVLESKGIISGKFFMEGKIYYDTPKQGEVGWSYQVAPVVLIKKDGQLIPYVIDPSFFAKPVPASEWEAKLTQKSKTEISRKYYTNRFAYGPNDRNAKYVYYQEESLNDMDDTNRNLARALYVLNQSSGRK